jgi:hypothetical protein
VESHGISSGVGIYNIGGYRRLPDAKEVHAKFSD